MAARAASARPPGDPVLVLRAAALQRCFKDASKMLQRCFEDALKMLRRCAQTARPSPDGESLLAAQSRKMRREGLIWARRFAHLQLAPRILLLVSSQSRPLAAAGPPGPPFVLRPPRRRAKQPVAGGPPAPLSAPPLGGLGGLCRGLGRVTHIIGRRPLDHGPRGRRAPRAALTF
eukprot:798721-Prorocentrum_minimum.AAC.1